MSAKGAKSLCGHCADDFRRQTVRSGAHLLTLAQIEADLGVPVHNDQRAW